MLPSASPLPLSLLPHTLMHQTPRRTSLSSFLLLASTRPSPRSHPRLLYMAARSTTSSSTRPARPSPGAGGAIKPGQTLAVPSLSASLVLLAPLQKRSPDGFDYRVLLLKRNATSRTFFSAHVFPGGNIDPIDLNTPAWSSLLPSLATTTNEEEKNLQAVKLCAIRETFEECGILLLDGDEKAQKRWDAIGEEERKRWRDKVHDDGSSFVDLFKMLAGGDGSATPALSSLEYRANWVTPRNMKRRFDTHFFLSILPPSSSPSSSPTPSSVTSTSIPLPQSQNTTATSDGIETISADWLTPSVALLRTLSHTLAQSLDPSLKHPTNDSIILFPPQFYLLAELVRTKSWRSLLSPSSSSSSSSPSLRTIPRQVHTFEPEIKDVYDDSGALRAATVLPGDPEHSLTNPSLAHPSDRHRTFVLLPKQEKVLDEQKREVWKKKPPPGLTVMGESSGFAISREWVKLGEDGGKELRLDRIVGVQRRGMERVFGEGWEDMSEGDTGEVKGSGGGGGKSKL